EGSEEDFLGWQHHEHGLDAVDLHRAVEQRPCAVVVADRHGQFEFRHVVSIFLQALPRLDSLAEARRATMTPNLAARLAGCSHTAWIAALAVALHLVLARPARADDLGDFQAAVASAETQYHIAMTTLETRGQAETAHEVQRLRQSWQVLAE